MFEKGTELGNTFAQAICGHEGRKRNERTETNDFRRLINEASIKSKQRGERGLSAKSVKRVSEDVLRKYKG